MHSFDLSPLFRSTVGFDRLSRLMDAVLSGEAAPGYPPYNIEKTGEDAYRITMAVAGFARDELELVSEGDVLTIRGKAKAGESEAVTFLHRGIAARAFERRFQLADSIKVTGAELKNGLLHVDLVREIPEAKKPRQIQIAA